MALPKIQTPVFTIEIPSTKEKKSFRPFLVREEKILLVAQEGTETDQINALKQIINNCCIDNINVDSFATFDLEYVFLKLRAKSVNNVVKLKFRDLEDEEVYDFEVNLDEIEVQFEPDINNVIKVNEEVGIKLKYPSVGMASNFTDVSSTDDVFTRILASCIDSVFDKNKVYPASETSMEELDDFINSLDHKSFEKIQEFFEKLPKLYHELKYTNKKGNERVIKLESIRDFFTLG